LPNAFGYRKTLRDTSKNKKHTAEGGSSKSKSEGKSAPKARNPARFFAAFFSKKNERKSEGFYGAGKGKVSARKNGVNFSFSTKA